MRMYDDYFFSAEREEDLVSEVREMESQSEWIETVRSDTLVLEPMESPLFAMDCSANYGFPLDLAYETAGNEGTRLMIVVNGAHYLLRDTAQRTLSGVSKLFGTALSRMSIPTYCETLNNAFEVAKGHSLILYRAGKISALHSDENGGYEIMPISELLKISREELSERFGSVRFEKGSNSYGLTSALWSLPDFRKDIQDLYQSILEDGFLPSVASESIMPVVTMESSDTAGSCARLIPAFLTASGREIRFVDGIAVKHSKRTNSTGSVGLEAFRKDAQSIFAKFDETAQVIRDLASIEILHVENAVIGLCKRYQIPKKYGEAARERAEMLSGSFRNSLSAHDLYLILHEAIAEACRTKASAGTIHELQENVAKIVKADWAGVDVGGTVCW